MGLLEEIAADLKEVRAEVIELRAQLSSNRPTKKILSVKEVVEITGITDETIRKYCMDDTFPNAYKVGSRWFIPEADLLNIKQV